MFYTVNQTRKPGGNFKWSIHQSMEDFTNDHFKIRSFRTKAEAMSYVESKAWPEDEIRVAA